jgi:hypothetical protein
VHRRLETAYRAVLRGLPDRPKRALLYREAHGRWPRGRAPRTFTEKINWRVVNDRRPMIGRLGDKLAMKDDAAASCPDLRIPRVLWAGSDLAEISRLALPERWVLKPNHATMRVQLGAGPPDVEALREVTAGWLDEPLYRDRGEWIYSQARRLLLVEEFLGAELADYKFLVFGGRVRLVQVDTGRHGTRHARRLYTPDWVPLPVVDPHMAMAAAAPPPSSLGTMTAVAEALGRDFDFIRVDLYDVDGVVWFGELTPYPGGGLDPFDPGLDRLLGGWWTLPPLDAVTGRRSAT